MGSPLFLSELLKAHEPERTTTKAADGRGEDRSPIDDLPIREIRVIRGGRFIGSPTIQEMGKGRSAIAGGGSPPHLFGVALRVLRALVVRRANPVRCPR